MITFKQFLIRENDEEGPEHVEAKRVAALIKRDCQHYLQEVGFDSRNPSASLMYRGIKNKAEPFQEMTARTDREPVDSSKTVHKALDDYFEKRFHFRFRSNGTFCTGSRTFATSYGHTYAIFPIGDFKYCWSPEIEDAYVFFDNSEFGLPEGWHQLDKMPSFNRDDHPDLEEEGIAYVDAPSWGKCITEYLTKHKNTYSNQDLAAAIKSRHEIMLGCTKYYALLCEGNSSHDPQFSYAKNHKVSSFADLVIDYL